jgi:hypothetical protein
VWRGGCLAEGKCSACSVQSRPSAPTASRGTELPLSMPPRFLMICFKVMSYEFNPSLMTWQLVQQIESQL